MARILYAVSPIGLGHATRAVAVGQRLAEAGVDLVFASGGPAAELLRSDGFRVEDVVSEPVPRFENGEMKDAALWYLRYWRGYRRTKANIARLLGELKPRAVVGDEEFSSITLALEIGLRHALITDELQLGFARSPLARVVERRVSAWYADLQRRASLLIVPERGKDEGNRRYVGPIVRRATRTKAQVQGELGVPSDRRLIVVAMSGTGTGDHLIEMTSQALSRLPDAVLLVMGNRGRKVVGNGIFDVGVVKDGQNVIAAADIVVSTAGKSTIDEAAAFGTPIVTIPIKHHSEQERNAAALGYTSEDLGRLPEIVCSKIGRREAAHDYEGAGYASQLILSVLDGARGSDSAA